VTAQDLYAYFSTFGEIKGVEIPRDHMTRTNHNYLEKFRGFAFVEFDERDDASAAIDNYDKSDFLNRTVRVRRARPIDSKPNYHKAVWANDDWMQQAELDKIQI
jgi:peptidyl-prolyl isomerase E (cyclophilin E)